MKNEPRQPDRPRKPARKAPARSGLPGPYTWTEEQFQQAIIDYAQFLGWQCYHTFDSRRSQPGFPDLVLWRPESRKVLFRELKAHDGRLSNQQIACLQSLTRAGADAQVWFPADWINGRIREQLQARPPGGGRR